MGRPGDLNHAALRTQVIDSHTEGEPTRVVVSGGPDLGSGPLRERLRRFRESADAFRRAVILEPRGSEALVGALLCEPEDPSCAAGVLFFNNTGYLGMCGHGTIGVAVTLAYLGRIGLGTHRVETPVGVVEVRLLDPNQVAIDNVPSFRYRESVSVDVESLGTVRGDVAWGGNWFFLAEQSPFPLVPENIARLTEAAVKVRRELRRRGITGRGGEEIDHVEFFGPPRAPDAHSRNFVYCPGGAYDRSPCGTGTSAKLACLAAAGKLRPGEVWVQESIIGSRFTASYREAPDGAIIPTLTGRGYVCSEAVLIQQPGDPFRHGISLGAAE
ncbi:MAG: proline racemase family protein [Armatimonadota bacterium]